MRRVRFFASGLAVLLMGIAAGPARADVSGLARHKQLYAVPAPGPVVVDGVLGDWDLSGQIDMFVLSEAQDTQSARFALMYDKENLYLSGVVRDSSPMMNRQDPAANGDRGWDADSCQFRITLDPERPYPETETVWPYRTDPKKVDARDDIKHLTLWYYTDRDEPALQMSMGMKYRTPRAEWSKGVVPRELYQAKYRKGEDDRGYTFEYAIPWSTLGAKAPLHGGHLVAGTVQFNWGTADGLKTAGGAAWAYDVMSGPGFTFQNAGVWGKIIFAPQGQVSRQLVEAGVPTEKPRPLKFSYDLPRDGQVTLDLRDENNIIRRILVAQGDRPKGRNEESWDGMDDQGKPLAAGTYTLQGIIHDPIRGEYQFSVHNSGQPPYPTDDGTGGWGGDHGAPSSASAFDGGVLLGWDGSEYGWGVIRVDPQGKKRWGIKTNAVLMANDGERFFTFDPHGFVASPGIRCFSLADGKPLAYANHESVLMAPAGGTAETDEPGGLACAGGKLFVSYPGRNLVAGFEVPSGKLVSQWTVPAPRALAVGPEGSIVALSGTGLVRLKEGKVSVLVVKGLEDAKALAVGPEGEVYVARQGKAQNVVVFDQAGKLKREIGKAGGRPAMGRYDAKGMFKPAGIAVDAAGRVWVAENADGPKRVSVWNAKSGAFEKEFFGGSAYFGYAVMDPAVPDEIYCHNVLWKVDWEHKTTKPISTIWRSLERDMVEQPDPSAYPQGFRMFTTPGKKQFGFGVAGPDRKSVFYRREGDVFKPFLATLRVDRSGKRYRPRGVADLDDPAKVPDGMYLWQDANDDQRMQVAELYRYSAKNMRLDIKAVTPDMSLWISGGYWLKPVGFGAQGQPLYDGAKLEKNFLNGTPVTYIWLDSDGSVFTHAPGQRLSLVKWSADGQRQWAYPNLANWHDSLSMPVVKAGRMYGMTGGMGTTSLLTGSMSYFGVVHLLQKDGTYVAAVMRDGRSSGAGADMGQPEGQGGSLVEVVTKPGDKPRTFVMAGGQDGRVTEVLGLDSIRPLPEQKLTLSEAEVRMAAEALAEYNASLGHNNLLVIAEGKKELATATPVEKALDGERSFAARAARDEKNLYVLFEVSAPNELINSASDPKLVFKGGNVLDIQLATDAGGDPKRKVPAPGDVRLLVTRQMVPGKAQPQPLAVLYRPKVAGFTGEPTVLRSPTGTESFDEITVVEGVELEYKASAGGFSATVTVPLNLLKWEPKTGQMVKMDLGYIYGNKTGNLVAARSYWKNDSFSANVVNDIPNESRLEPARWGEAKVQ